MGRGQWQETKAGSTRPCSRPHRSDSSPSSAFASNKFQRGHFAILGRVRVHIHSRIKHYSNITKRTSLLALLDQTLVSTDPGQILSRTKLKTHRHHRPYLIANLVRNGTGLENTPTVDELLSTSRSVCAYICICKRF